MGGVLTHGFDTLVRDILTRKEKRTLPAFEDISIGRFKDFVQQFAAKSNVKTKEDLLLSSSYINKIWSNLKNVTNGTILSFCTLIIESLVQIAVPLNKRRQHLFVQDIQDALISICTEPGCTEYLYTFFQNLIKWAKEEIAKLSAGSALNNIISGAAATLQETGKHASKKTVAYTAAKTALAASVLVDGTLLGITASHSYYQYQMGYSSFGECKQHIAQRSTATLGSIGGTTTGAFVGTLVFPGVGTFVGGVIGGMFGDFLGSKLGVAAYDAMKPKE